MIVGGGRPAETEPGNGHHGQVPDSQPDAEPDSVRIWLVRTRLSEPAEVARLAAVLDDEERRRAAAMSDPDSGRCFVVAHAAARQVVGACLGVPAHELRWSYGPHGKPEPAEGHGVQMNLSHSAGFAMVAVTEGRRVGVDLQRLDTGVTSARMARRWYPPEEASFIAGLTDQAERAAHFARLWVRKEACVKAEGGRLVAGLGLRVQGPAPVVVAGPDGPLLVHDLPAPDGFAAAVALAGTGGFQVIQRQWRPGSGGELSPFWP